MQNEWYSVRCVFKHKARGNMQKRNLYEERITLWKSDSFDNAIELAENEAEQYAVDADAEYIGLAQAFLLYPEEISDGCEVFSLMRDHNYSPKRYLDRYFDTGFERQKHCK